MSRTISPAINKPYGLKRVCEAWEVPRSSFYRIANPSSKKRGVKPVVEEPKLLEAIREDLRKTPFKGEGHRKVHARLKRLGIKAGSFN